MRSFEEFLRDELEFLNQDGRLRHLPSLAADCQDLSSNDYLGFARSVMLRRRIVNHLLEEAHAVGSTGSRLLTGNSSLAEATEAAVAHLFWGEGALIFSSGYAANVGLLSSVAGREDVILYDELVHASIRDGIRLGGARAWKFPHNDCDGLRDLLCRAPRRGRLLVVVESVYSMDGDVAPLPDIVALCQAYGADCIVDEAHSTGIIGEGGAGLCVKLGITDQVAARVYTFGKALGVHGAAVVGSGVLRSFLINKARSFIYSTAPGSDFFIAIREAVRLCGSPEGDRQRSLLWDRVERMQEALRDGGVAWHGESPIVPILVPGATAVREAALRAREAGHHVLPIRAPTVPEGQERIRICVHAYDDPSSYRAVVGLLQETI